MRADTQNPEDPVVAALLAVAGVLEAEGSRYALIGGLAAAQHGVIRATQDVDFLLTVPTVRLPEVLDKLKQAGCDIDTSKVIREWGAEHMTQFRCHDVPIDWLKPVIPLFQQVLDRATRRDVLGHQIHIVDAEGIILMKMVAFRPEDRRDVEALATVSAQVNWNYIEEQLLTVFEAQDQRLTWLRTSILNQR
jgi:predicted nucleotidyltransferase